MKKLLVFVWLCVSVEHAVAQIRYQMGFSNKDWIDVPYMKPCNTKDSVAVDTVRLEAFYEYRFMRKPDMPDVGLIRLQVGDRYMHQRDLRLSDIGLANYLIENEGDWEKGNQVGSRVERTFGKKEPANLFIQLLGDRETGDQVVTAGHYLARNRPLEYRDPAVLPMWEFVEGDSIIMGYPCLQARTRWRGREWQAWYSPDLPCSEGPWKLRGLPGLILTARTEGFSFQCVSLLQPEELIYTYLYKPIKRCKNRSEYRRIEREAHEHPVSAFKAFTAQDATLWYFDADGKHVLDDSFSMPYTPIELE